MGLERGRRTPEPTAARPPGDELGQDLGQLLLEARRRELLDSLALDDQPGDRLDDTHGLVDALVRPMTELLASGPSHYARFLEQVRRHPVLSTAAGIDDWPASQEVMRRLGRPGVRRGQALATTLFALLADAERDGHSPDPDDLVAMLVGLLTALQAFVPPFTLMVPK